MKRVLFAAAAAVVVAGCLDFGSAFERCVASGSCGGGAGENDGGGGGAKDAGDSGMTPLVDAGQERDGGAEADGGFDAGDPRRACLLPTCALGTWCTERSNPGGPVLYGVWAQSPCDVWAVGTAGTVVRFDGGEWKSNTGLFASKSIFAVQGRAPNDVWLIGQTGLIRRWNGSTYLDLTVPTANLFGLGARFKPARIVGPSSTFLVEDDAGVVVQEPGTTTGQQYGLFQTSPNDVWATGVLGGIRHYDGGSPWTRMAVPAADDSKTFAGVWGTSSTDMWFAGDNSILHWDGGSFASHVPPRPDFINAMWGASGNEIWAVGDNGTVLRWSGGPSWTVVDAGVAVNLTAVTGYSDGGQLDVWVTGPDELILHYRR